MKFLLLALLGVAAVFADVDPSFGPPAKRSVGARTSSNEELDEYGIPVRYVITLKSDAVSKQKASSRQTRISAADQENNAVKELVQGLSSLLPKAANARGESKDAIEVHDVIGSLNLASVSMSKSQVKELAKNSNVESVAQDTPIFPTGIRRELLAEVPPYGIALSQADQIDQVAGAIKMCIIDSGLQTSHEDFVDQMNDNKLTGQSTAGQWYQDNCKHGTHVAGTIAAQGGNGKGVLGVNPTGDLLIHNVQVFHNSNCGWAYSSGLLGAIQNCKDEGAKIVSMSLGGGGWSQNTYNFMQDNNDMLFISAAGNAGNSQLSYPASYDVPNSISVAALDSAKNIASFSQYNSQVDIAGPGVSVRSTVGQSSYASYSGTSMATPHVSGIAAKIWNRHPDCTADQVRQALFDTAEDLGATGKDIYYGHGLVQAKAADDQLAGCGNSGPTPTPEPTPVPDYNVLVEIKFDNYPTETRWTISDNKDDELFSGPNSAVSRQLVLKEEFELPPASDYKFTITDSYGDGVCCGYGQGYYKLVVNSIVVKDGGDFSSTESTVFSIDDDSSTPLPSPAPTPLPSPAPTPNPSPAPSTAPTPNPTPAPSPAPTKASTCCSGQTSAGCDDSTCSASVCATDNYCCTNFWDRDCVDMAVASSACMCGGQVAEPTPMPTYVTLQPTEQTYTSFQPTFQPTGQTEANNEAPPAGQCRFTDCGKKSKDACWCDIVCAEKGDCCENFDDRCGDLNDRAGAHCECDSGLVMRVADGSLISGLENLSSGRRLLFGGDAGEGGDGSQRRGFFSALAAAANSRRNGVQAVETASGVDACSGMLKQKKCDALLDTYRNRGD